jgi:flagellar biosynthetic protein FliQ
MTPDMVSQLATEALVLAFRLGAPLVGAAAVVGLVCGFLQAITQLQDATTAFAFKLAAVAAVLLLTLPWAGGQLARYGERLFDLVAQVKA